MHKVLQHFFLIFAFLGTAVFGAVPKEAPVVIIGAGLSGLASAYYLKKLGISAHVIEISPRIGGRVKTVRYERGKSVIYADSGMEEYWESNPAVGVIRELGLETREDVALSSIVLNGKLYPLGSDSPETFKKRIFTPQELAALEKFKTTASKIISQIRPDRTVPAQLLSLKEPSFATWVANQNLPEKVKEWVRVSIECEVGTSWDRVSALDGIFEFHIFLGEGEKAVRILGGNDKFTQGMLDKIGHDRLSLNTRVNRIRTRGNHVYVTYTDLANNHNGVVKASHVVSTIPLYRLFEVQFEPELSSKKREAIQTMSWGAYFKAHLFVRPAGRKYWTKKGASILPLLSDSELGVVYEGNPDQENQIQILSLLTFGDHAEKFNMAPQAQTRTELFAALDKLMPGLSKQVQEVEFHRYHPRAIAAWPPGRSRFDDLAQEIRRPDNRVYLAGDFTESSHSDGAFISARRVADQISKLERKLP